MSFRSRHINLHKRKRKRFYIKPIWTKLIGSILICGSLYVISPQTVYQAIYDQINNFLMRQDFVVQSVRIVGADKAQLKPLQDKIDALKGMNIVSLDIESLKKEIEALQWVERADIERKLPNTLIIDIKEEVAQAVLIKSGKRFLLNKYGKIIVEASNDTGLIEVSGEDANILYWDFLNKTKFSSALFSNIESIEFKGKRRWDVHLKNGTQVKLPQNELEEAIAIFDKHFKECANMQTKFIIDLRLAPSKIYLSIS